MREEAETDKGSPKPSKRRKNSDLPLTTINIQTCIYRALQRIGVPAESIFNLYLTLHDKKLGAPAVRKDVILCRRPGESESTEEWIKVPTSDIRKHLAGKLMRDYRQDGLLEDSPSQQEIARSVGWESHASVKAAVIQWEQYIAEGKEPYNAEHVLAPLTRELRRDIQKFLEEGRIVESINNGSLSRPQIIPIGLVKVIQDSSHFKTDSASVNGAVEKREYNNGSPKKGKSNREETGLTKIVKEGIRARGAYEEEVETIYERLQGCQDDSGQRGSSVDIGGVKKPLSLVRAALAHWMYVTASGGTLDDIEVSYALNYANPTKAIQAIEEENDRVNEAIHKRISKSSTISE